MNELQITMNPIKQAAVTYAEKCVFEKNIDFSLEDKILNMLVDAYTAGYNDGIKGSVVRVNINAIPKGWSMYQLMATLYPHKVLIEDEPSPWIDILKEEPSEPTDWDVKGIIGTKKTDGFLDMWLFGYVHPDGWVRIDDLSSLRDNEVQYWMKIPQLPKAIMDKLSSIYK